MISLEQYGPIIVADEVANEIYNKIKKELIAQSSVYIDMSAIKLMVTKCAKLIYGRLYLELGAENFFNNIQIAGASDNIRAVITAGIKQAIEEGK